MKRLPRLFVADIQSMSPRQHLYVWILPTSLLTLLMLFYFSGIDPLVQLVAPWANREWGLLENLQVALLLAAAGVAFHGVKVKPLPIQKVGFLVAGCAALFIALEEMDYGRHILQLFSLDHKTVFEETFNAQNVHNMGNNSVYFRRFSYLFVMMVLGLSPFLDHERLPPVIRYLIPRPRMLLLVPLFLVSYQLPRYLVEEGIFDAGPLNPNNTGEFTEMTVYAIVLVYFIHLVFEKEWPAPADASARSYTYSGR